MAEVTVKDPAYSGHALTISTRLFSPYSFFVSIDVPHRKAVMKLINKGGGTVVLRPSNTTPIDYWLVPDFFEGNTRADAKRVSIVLDSARVGQFPPLRAAGGEEHYSPFDKTVPKRTEYTDGEVRFLTAYMDMHVGKPPLGKSDLNYLYELMNHKHSEESIRSKLKQLVKFPVALEQTKNVTYQAPVVQNDVVAKKTPDTPVIATRFADILAKSVSAAKKTSADTVLATPVQVKPLAMSTQLPDTTTEVPDTPMPAKKKEAEKTRQGKTQVPDTPETKKDTVPMSSQKQQSSQKSSQSSSQSSTSVIPDTPARSKETAATQVPATPAEHTKSRTKSPSKQSTLPFKSVTESPASTAFDSGPLVMRHSPKKNRDKGKEPLYPQVPFEVENSSSPSSTRFPSSMVVPDSQQSMSSTPLRFDVKDRDSSGITDSQVYTAPLAIPPGSSQFTVDDSGSGSSLGRVAAARQMSESGDSSWSRESSASLDSTTGTRKSRAGRRTRASRSLAKNDPPPEAVQTGSCLLYPRKFVTRFSHHPVRGIFYGIQRVSTQQIEVSQSGTQHVETTQIETRQIESIASEGVVATMTSSQSSSSFAEDSHIIVDDSEEEKGEEERGKEAGVDEMDGDDKGEKEGASSGSDDSSDEDSSDEDSSDEEEIVQVPDSQNSLLRDAQLPHDSTDDVSSVPDSQVDVSKRPNAFTEFPVSSERRYVDSSLDLDVSVRSLPSIESIRARLKEFSQRVSGVSEDVLSSAADKRFSRSSLGRQITLLELDSDGEVVDESYIEEEEEMVVEEEEEMVVDEVAGEETESSKEYPSILYEDAQRQSPSSQDIRLVQEEESPEKSKDRLRTMARLQTLLPNDVIDELLDSYQSEEDYPSEEFQVLPVPIRKDTGSAGLESPFSVLDFPYQEVSFDDIRDDFDYDEEVDQSQTDPMIGSLGIRPAVECVALFLKEGVEEYLASLQGHDSDVSAAFIVALCMSRQISEHTTLDEAREMTLRFPRHVKFFAPMDDQVIASFIATGVNDEKLATLKKRHFADDISKRSDYLKTISGALAVEFSTQGTNAEAGEAVPGSSRNSEQPSVRTAQHVKQEMFDDLGVPRNQKSRSPSGEVSAGYDMGSSPEVSIEERKRVMEEKIRLHREKKKAKKARRELRASLRLEEQARVAEAEAEAQAQAEAEAAAEKVAKAVKKKRRRKEEKEEDTEEVTKPAKKKRRRKEEVEEVIEEADKDKKKKKKKKKLKSKKSLEPVDAEVVDVEDTPPDRVEEVPSTPDVPTPKPKRGRPRKNPITTTEPTVPESPRIGSAKAAKAVVSETPKEKSPRRKRGRPKKIRLSEV